MLFRLLFCSQRWRWLCRGSVSLGLLLLYGFAFPSSRHLVMIARTLFKAEFEDGIPSMGTNDDKCKETKQVKEINLTEANKSVA